MSFIDLRFAADLLRQGFSKEEIMSLISGKPESDAGTPAAAPIIKEETPSAVSGDKPPEAVIGDKPPAAAQVAYSVPAAVPAAAPVPAQAAAPPAPPAADPAAHARTEAREEKITFEQLLAKSS